VLFEIALYSGGGLIFVSLPDPGLDLFAGRI
jgi:hypothetical protein